MTKQTKLLCVFLLISTQFLIAQRSGRLLFTSKLAGFQEVPAVVTSAKGLVTVAVDGNVVTINAVFDGLSGRVTGCHFHKGFYGQTGPTFTDFLTNVRGNRLYLKTTMTNAQITDLLQGSVYLNVHTAANPSGEIRGQLNCEKDYSFRSVLTSAQEVPAVSRPVNGVATLVLDRLGKKINYKMVVNNLSGPITAANLHYGTAGQIGDIAFGLSAINNVLSGSFEATNPFIENLFSGKVYINVRTAANPNGEVRGQINFSDNGLLFDGLIEGAQEVPAVSTAAKGIIHAVLRPTLDTLDYVIQTTGITPSAAHFHLGNAGKNGDVLVNVFSDLAQLPGLRFGFIEFTPASLRALLKDSLYVNFHTTLNPNGEIRGQLKSVLRTGFVANLCGDQAVPKVSTTASGAAYVSLSRDKTNYILEVVTNGLSSNAIGAEFYVGAKGVVGNTGTNFGSFLTDNAILLLGSTQEASFTDAIVAGNTYLNFSTATNFRGEIRGQVGVELVQECLANAVADLNGAPFTVNIAPNPVAERFELTFDSPEPFDAPLVISDLAGRQMSVQNAQILRGLNKLSVNVAGLNSGIYFVQMRKGTRLLFTEKLVKQ